MMQENVRNEEFLSQVSFNDGIAGICISDVSIYFQFIFSDTVYLNVEIFSQEQN